MEKAKTLNVNDKDILDSDYFPANFLFSSRTHIRQFFGIATCRTLAHSSTVHSCDLNVDVYNFTCGDKVIYFKTAQLVLTGGELIFFM